MENYREYMAQVKSEKTPQYEPFIGSREKELVNDVLDSNWLSEGKYTRKFEDNLANFCGSKHALAMANGTGALTLGLKALGVGLGDEVIVPSFTHPADVNCIDAVGATARFCDIDLKTYTICPQSFKEKITSNTKAVIVVHLFGFSANMSEIMNISNEHDIFVIEDCAQALGSKYKGKSVGTFGNFGILSFFADKTLTTGEGGMFISNDSNLINEVNIYKHDGRRERGIDVIERLGYNFRITELQSAIGVAQFERLETFTSKKINNNKLFSEFLKDIPGITMVEANEDTYRVPHRVVIAVDDPESMKNSLATKGIGCRRFYVPMHRQPCCSDNPDFKESYPKSEEAYSSGLCLPSYPMLELQDIERICKEIKNCLGI